MANRSAVLVTADDLMRRFAAGAPVTLLDVRWQLSQPDGYAAYLQEHLPGAVYVSLEDDLSDHRVTGRGRHPLPSGPALQAAARRWGVRDESPRGGLRRLEPGGFGAGVVGASRRRVARRPHPRRRTDRLEGGWWGPRERAGRPPTRNGDGAPRRPLRRGAANRDRRPGASGAPAGCPCAGTLPRGRRAGGLRRRPYPGARNLPSTSLLAADGTFLPDPELVALLADRGVGDEPVGVYCGSGVTAAVVIAALTALGRDAALFPGSWSQWSSEPGRPIARGAE